MSESFKEISDRLLSSSHYEEIDEVNDDIAKLVAHYEKLQTELKSWEETAEIHAKAMKVLEDRNSELKRKLDLAVEALSGLIFHCVDFNQGEGSFVLAMEIEKADQALKEIKEI